MEQCSPAREHAHAIASAISDYMDARESIVGSINEEEAYRQLVKRIDDALTFAASNSGGKDGRI